MADYARVERLIDRYDRAIDGLESDVIERLNASIDAAYRNLERELRRLYPRWQSQGSLYAVQRRLLLLQELGDLLQVIRPQLRNEYEQLFADAIALSHQAGGSLADELVGLINPGYPLREFADIPIEAVAAQARDGVTRLYRYNDEFARAVSGVVEQGLTQGWGAAKVAQALRGSANMRGQFGVAELKSKAETIARTEVMSALNTAAENRYEQAGIDYVQVQVTRSEALCSYCLARNMRVYRRGDIRLQFHPRCRCIILPWSPNWQKQGLTDDDFAQEYRDRTMREAEQQGVKPNYGPTYWERKNQGMEQAPKPVWSPKDAKPPAITRRRSVASNADDGGPVRVAGRGGPRGSPGVPIPQSARAQQSAPTAQQVQRRIRRDEDGIRRNNFETMIAYDNQGRAILRKTGGAFDVALTQADVDKMRGQIVTHNHPIKESWKAKERTSGVSFSVEDIQTASTYEFAEIRAVTGGYRHSMKPPEGGWNADWWRQNQGIAERIDAEILPNLKAQRDRNFQNLLGQGVDRPEAWDESMRILNRDYAHERWQRFAKETGVDYRRERWSEEPNDD